MNFTYLLDDFDEAYAPLEQDAGVLLSQNLQDRSVRAGLSLAGWKPKKNSAAQAVEWWVFDWEYAFSPVGVNPKLARNFTLTVPRSKVQRCLLLLIM